MTSLKTHIALFITLAASILGYSQDVHQVWKLNELAENSSYKVYDDYYGDNSSSVVDVEVVNSIYIERIFNGVEFSEGSRLEVIGVLKTYKRNGDLLANGTETITLDLNESDRYSLYKFSSAYLVDFVPTSIRVYDKFDVEVLSSEKDLWLSNVNLAVTIAPDRIHDLVLGSTPEISAQITTENEIVFNWDYQAGATQYQLEWYFWDEDAPIEEIESSRLSLTSGFPPELSVETIDKNPFDRFNGTKVYTNENAYNITNTFDKGKLFYRVRSVNVNVNKPDQWVYSPWSGYGTLDITETFQSDKNWAFQRSFGMDGQKSEVISYSDGTGRSRQELAKNYEEEHVIVKEHFYDYDGAQTIDVMPGVAPTNSMEFMPGYTQVESQSGDVPLNRDFFGHDNAQDNPFKLASKPNTSDSYYNNYYSEYNPYYQDALSMEQYLPEGQEYAYSQTVFDYEGRVTKQSSPGALHTLNSEHFKEITYGTEDQDKLNRLFGNSAGNALFYSKVMTRDENGLYSISSYNQAGQLIYTAKVGKSSDNIDGIGPSSTVDYNVMLSNQWKKISDWSMRLEHRHLAATRGDCFIDLGIDWAEFEMLCNQDFSCSYVLSVEVTSNKGEEMELTCDSETTNRLVFEIDKSKFRDGTFDKRVSFTTPRPGSYNIECVLSIDQEEYQESRNDFYDFIQNDALCLESRESLIQTYLNELLLGCESEGGYNCYQEALLVEGLTPGTKEYDVFIADCESYYNEPEFHFNKYLSESSDPMDCEGIKEVLIRDFIPEGQYFYTDYDEGFRNGFKTRFKSYYLDQNPDFDESSISWTFTDMEELWSEGALEYENVKEYLLDHVDNHPEYIEYEWCSFKDELEVYGFQLSTKKLSDYSGFGLGGLEDWEEAIAFVLGADPLDDSDNLDLRFSFNGVNYDFNPTQDGTGAIQNRRFKIWMTEKINSFEPVDRLDFTGSLFDYVNLVAQEAGGMTNEEKFKVAIDQYVIIRSKYFFEIRRDYVRGYLIVNNTAEALSNFGTPFLTSEGNEIRFYFYSLGSIVNDYRDTPESGYDLLSNFSPGIGNEQFVEGAQEVATIKGLPCRKKWSGESWYDVQNEPDFDAHHWFEVVQVVMPDQSTIDSEKDFEFKAVVNYQKLSTGQIGSQEISLGDCFAGLRANESRIVTADPFFETNSAGFGTCVTEENDIYTQAVQAFNGIAGGRYMVDNITLYPQGDGYYLVGFDFKVDAYFEPFILTNEDAQRADQRIMSIDIVPTQGDFIRNQNEDAIYDWEGPKRFPCYVEAFEKMNQDYFNSNFVSGFQNDVDYQGSVTPYDYVNYYYYVFFKNYLNIDLNDGIPSSVSIVRPDGQGGLETVNWSMNDVYYNIIKPCLIIVPETPHEWDRSSHYFQFQNAVDGSVEERLIKDYPMFTCASGGSTYREDCPTYNEDCNCSPLAFALEEYMDVIIPSLKDDELPFSELSLPTGYDFHTDYNGDGYSDQYDYALISYIYQRDEDVDFTDLAASSVLDLSKEDGTLVSYSLEEIWAYLVSPLIESCFYQTDGPDLASIVGKDGDIASNYTLFNCTSENACLDEMLPFAIELAEKAYQEQIAEQMLDFEEAYLSSCFNTSNGFVLNTDFIYKESEYQYTLYHYDAVGNLLATVQPEAVYPLPDGGLLDRVESIQNQLFLEGKSMSDITEVPVYWYDIHNLNLVSSYEMNSNNQVEESRTPDAGSSIFYYDNLGRLMLSQNEQQAERRTDVLNSPTGSWSFSYTLLDDLDRVKEVGEIHVPYPVGSVNDEKIRIKDIVLDRDSQVSLTDFIVSGIKKEVTRTFYDEAFLADADVNAQFDADQRKRFNRGNITAVFYYENGPSQGYYDNAVFYAYGEHGVVETFVQDIPGLSSGENRFRKTEYDYELLKGQVEHISYQEGKRDEFYTKMEYDSQGRVKGVYTSRDDVKWERDVEYFFYRHGALARVELGEDKVQGLDYAYTLRGQLKGVNSSVLSRERDMGRDGLDSENNIHSGVSRDAMAYTLGYYDGDYLALGALGSNPTINHTNHFLADVDYNSEKIDSYYNGLISNVSMSLYTKVSDSDEFGDLQSEALLSTYSYDQLYRLTQRRAFLSEDIMNTNQWTLPDYSSEEDALQAYYSHYQYDANGNLTNLVRNGRSSEGDHSMDNIQYYYHRSQNGNHAGRAELVSNRLYHVYDDQGVREDKQDLEANDDPSDNANYDLGSKSFSSVDGSDMNFVYDKLGNIIADQSSEIEEIKWTSTRRVKEIIRPSGTLSPSVEFFYDAFGSRIGKLVKTRSGGGETPITSAKSDWEYYSYSLDASGTPLSIYKHEVEDVVGDWYGRDWKIKTTVLEDQHLYGAGRLGVYKRNEVIHDLSKGIDGSADFRKEYKVENGKKFFELTNHLGSVVTVVSDKKQRLVEEVKDYLDLLMITGTPGIETVGDYKLISINSEPDPYRGNVLDSYGIAYANLVSGEKYTLTLDFNFDVLNPANSVDVLVRNGEQEFTSTIGSNGLLRIDFIAREGASSFKFLPENDNIVSAFKYKVVSLDQQFGFVPDIVSVSDYYPYGMMMGSEGHLEDENGNKIYKRERLVTNESNTLEVETYYVDNTDSEIVPNDVVEIFEPSRSWSKDSYRYGYNGMEKDDEVSGSGNHYTTEFRQLDPRLGRWLSVDPLASEFPWQSPYVSMDNNPISLVDPLGLSAEDWVEKEDGSIYWNDEVTSDDDEDLEEGEIYRGTEFRRFEDIGASTYNDVTYNSDKTITSTIEFRPDIDGVVTQDEAIDWYHFGGGEPLTVDFSLFELGSSRLSMEDFDNTNQTIDFFNGWPNHPFSSDIKYRPARDETLSDVYGTFTLQIVNANTGEVRPWTRPNGSFDTFDYSGLGSILGDILRSNSAPQPFDFFSTGTAIIRLESERIQHIPTQGF